MAGSARVPPAGEQARPGTRGRGDTVLAVLTAVTRALVGVQFAAAGFGAFSMVKTATDSNALRLLDRGKVGHVLVTPVMIGRAVQLTHCAARSPAIWPVVASSRFQAPALFPVTLAGCGGSFFTARGDRGM